jgi:hypothetical protein
MAMVDILWLATRTRRDQNADTDAERLNLTVNVNGEDIADTHFYFPSLGRGEAGLSGGTHGYPSETLSSPIESTLLTNSSIRLGMRTDDAWGPQDVLLLGSTERQIIALAIETEIQPWLSTDRSEGKLSMPIRLVSQGTSSTLIRCVMLLAVTAWGEKDYGTNDTIELQIAAGGGIVLDHEIHDPNLREGRANWFEIDALAPFTRGDVLSNGGIQLAIQGKNAWLPKVLFVYGLDTATGRPNEIVDLVAIPEWTLGVLSTDPKEGAPSVSLPVV